MFASIGRQRRSLIITAFLIFACILFFWMGYFWGPSHSWGVKPWQFISDFEQPSEPDSTSISDSQRTNATLIALVRNGEVDGMVQSMRQLEQRWNHKYNYSWIFFNDEPFDDHFKQLTQAATQAECKYELIPPEHWEPPPWIDLDRFEQSLHRLEQENVRYGGLPSYHKMCRWNSGFFYKHPALADYKWYWRVEPSVKFFCDINYDVFKYMEDNNKVYGFTISAYDNPQSVETLWPETIEFLAAHPEYAASNNSVAWLTDGEGRPESWMANGYSTCHFWSNFEVGDLDFWRSQAYEEYFDHLDKAGGFFYERWGDAPVHSVALGLFEDATRLHWFKDIAYQHENFRNCPQCGNCDPAFTHDPGTVDINCLPKWLKYYGAEDESTFSV